MSSRKDVVLKALSPSKRRDRLRTFKFKDVDTTLIKLKLKYTLLQKAYSQYEQILEETREIEDILEHTSDSLSQLLIPSDLPEDAVKSLRKVEQSTTSKCHEVQNTLRVHDRFPRLIKLNVICQACHAPMYDDKTQDQEKFIITLGCDCHGGTRAVFHASCIENMTRDACPLCRKQNVLYYMTGEKWTPTVTQEDSGDLVEEVDLT